MDDSPDVQIRLVTTDKKKAEARLAEVEKEAQEWMEDDLANCMFDCEETGNWAEAAIAELDVPGDLKPGDFVLIVTHTLWFDCVETYFDAFCDLDSAMAFISQEKKALAEQFEGIEPWDEDASFEESMHLHDSSVMVDAYFEVKAFKFD